MSERTIRFATVSLVVLSTVACISAPMNREKVDRVLATGWSIEDKPVALVEVVKLTRGWYPITPDGPGIFDMNSRLQFDLVTESGRTEVRIPTPGEWHFADACFLRKSGRFALFVSSYHPVKTSEFYLVSLDGAIHASPFPVEQSSFICTDDEVEVIVSHPDRMEFEGYSFSAGSDRQIQSEIKRFSLYSLTLLQDWKPEWHPCPSGYRWAQALSPDGNQLAIACTPSSENGGIWIVGESLKARRLTSIPISYRVDRDRSFADAYQAASVFGSLAWSPNMEYLYFCASPGSPGYAISTTNGSHQFNPTGLIGGSWSFDSSTVAGFYRNKLQSWVPLPRQNIH